MVPLFLQYVQDFVKVDTGDDTVETGKPACLEASDEKNKTAKSSI